MKTEKSVPAVTWGLDVATSRRSEPRTGASVIVDAPRKAIFLHSPTGIVGSIAPGFAGEFAGPAGSVGVGLKEFLNWLCAIRKDGERPPFRGLELGLRGDAELVEERGGDLLRLDRTV